MAGRGRTRRSDGSRHTTGVRTVSAMGMQQTGVSDGAQPGHIDVLRRQSCVDELVTIGRPEVEVQRAIGRPGEPPLPALARGRRRPIRHTHIVTNRIAARPDTRTDRSNKFRWVEAELGDPGSHDLTRNARGGTSPAGVSSRHDARRRVSDQDRYAVGSHDGKCDRRIVSHEAITLEPARLDRLCTRSEHVDGWAMDLRGPYESVARHVQGSGQHRPIACPIRPVVPHIETAGRECVGSHEPERCATQHGSPRLLGPDEAGLWLRPQFWRTGTINHDSAEARNCGCTPHPGGDP